jgi:N6-L-threonylcarbamoyladenine synthase
MKILGIETSCDDTGISIIEAKGRKNPAFRILINRVASQVKIHQKYGGVYPTMAKREHETNLPIVLGQVLKESRIKKLRSQEIDAIAITHGPGLSPCLWVGLNWAKDLAKKWNIPLIPVNHMEGHLLISLFSQRNSISNFQFPISKRTFPAIALLVSGGHTQLILVRGLGRYTLLGETRDDAAGECFDKTARILGRPYPGGPAIAAEAAQIQKSKFKIALPRPMLHTKDYDFSFSGLKTAVLYDWKSRSKRVQESKEYVRAMAKEIQQAIIDVLLVKTARAAQEYNAKSIILGGGVAANKELRRQLSRALHTKYRIPLLAAPKELCTDNGAMIAVAGYATWLRSAFKKQKHIEANPNLSL